MNNYQKVFTDYLTQENEESRVILAGQVVKVNSITEEHFCMQVQDIKGSFEFVWEKEINLGQHVIVVGRFFLKRFNNFILKKIYASQISIIDSDQYMIFLIEVELASRNIIQQNDLKADENHEFKIQKSNVKQNEQLSQMAVSLFKKSVIINLGDKQVNQFEIFSEIQQPKEEEDKILYENILQRLKQIGMMNPNNSLNIEHAQKLINIILRHLEQVQRLNIKQAIIFINKQYQTFGTNIFNDSLAYCIFNVLVSKSLALEGGDDSIQYYQPIQLNQ